MYSPPEEIGTLIAVLLKARHLPNRRTLGKQDPYCTLRLGQNAQSTKIDKRGGQTPFWNHELRFQVTDADENFKLTVFDDNDGKPELVGDCILELKPALAKPSKEGHDKWHELQYKQKYAGEVYIEMTFYRTKPIKQIKLTRSSSTNALSSLPPPPRSPSRRPLPQSPAQASLSTPITPPHRHGLSSLSPSRSNSHRQVSVLQYDNTVLTGVPDIIINDHTTSPRRPLPSPPHQHTGGHFSIDQNSSFNNNSINNSHDDIAPDYYPHTRLSQNFQSSSPSSARTRQDEYVYSEPDDLLTAQVDLLASRLTAIQSDRFPTRRQTFSSE
ncbi:C2 domain-containing protein [Lipomyces japonicus]|uniref:C2 domain-containing protein n=1 Tax=Lipomyces japonicus TaxID=56871 RepID=UPI0034CFDFD0